MRSLLIFALTLLPFTVSALPSGAVHCTIFYGTLPNVEQTQKSIGPEMIIDLRETSIDGPLHGTSEVRDPWFEYAFVANADSRTSEVFQFGARIQDRRTGLSAETSGLFAPGGVRNRAVVKLTVEPNSDRRINGEVLIETLLSCSLLR